jgi:hypothetical protein
VVGILEGALVEGSQVGVAVGVREGSKVGKGVG